MEDVDSVSKLRNMSILDQNFEKRRFLFKIIENDKFASISTETMNFHQKPLIFIEVDPNIIDFIKYTTPSQNNIAVANNILNSR